MRDRLRESFASMAGDLSGVVASHQFPGAASEQVTAIRRGLADLAEGRLCVVSREDYDRLNDYTELREVEDGPEGGEATA